MFNAAGLASSLIAVLLCEAFRLASCFLGEERRVLMLDFQLRSRYNVYIIIWWLATFCLLLYYAGV